MSASTPKLSLNDDRLFPAEPPARKVARGIYRSVRDLPIISPHGHVPPQWLADDTPFADPTTLLLTPDHYINRLLHANGVDLEHLGVAQGELGEDAARAAFRTFCDHWPDFAGTAMSYWMREQLVGIFGVTVRPSAETADRIYDRIAGQLAEPEFQPRALLDTFGIRFLATTDDPCDDLAVHDRIDREVAITTRVAPTFRPDRYLEPGRPDWPELTRALGDAAGVDTSTLAGFTEAMEIRRRYFKDHGAVSSDHSHADLGTLFLDAAEGERIYALAQRGEASADECLALRRHLFTDQARMACEDGLTMTAHPAVARNHDPDAFARFGADVGADIPLGVEATRGLQPLLAAFGNHPNFTLVLFTIDETVYSRELGPLAGWYRAVHVGVPWWFLDAPDAILRFKSAVTEMAGFSRLSGMIDDTRAFFSIPARHDMSRRLDAAHLARLVVEHRLDEDEALDIAHRLVVEQPAKVFHL